VAALLLASILAMSTQAATPEVFAHEKSADELAHTLLSPTVKEIAQAKVVRGKFIHRKYLSEIPAPLEATGELLFLRNRGLYWHTLTPFESTFILTPTGMVQKDEGGIAIKMDAATQPGVRAAASIFMALFAVDLKTLSNEFHLFGAPTPTGWQLGLRPKNSALSAVFTQAIVSGAARVQEIELQDAHGDRTVIRLLDTELLQREPTLDERARLAN